MEKWEAVQGIYIHIPFCLQKCLYCDFASFSQQGEAVMEQYTRKLCQEILAWRQILPVDAKATIYFGGGTPSVLPLACILQIVQALKDRGLWQQPAEATIEANPGTLTAEKLAVLKAAGFDRISMGVQSLNDKELKAMGRIHNAQQALNALAEARQAGFTRINGDLIYGYPGQTQASVLDSVEGLVKAGLTHISVYGLTVEPGTPLAKLVEEKKLSLPEEDTTVNMYEAVTAYLPEHGLQRYEISNYAAAGQESLHNLVYWHYFPYLGFGLGATGFDGVNRYTNSSNLQEYLQGALASKEVLTASTRLSECIFMGLRLSSGISMEEIAQRFPINFQEKYGNIIEECQRQNLMWQTGKRIGLTATGMEVGNIIFEKFL